LCLFLNAYVGISLKIHILHTLAHIGAVLGTGIGAGPTEETTVL